ncbi:MAG TPA: phenylalanine--tRNA ligase subunit beta [Deltaproteobacteria bacterium]|nr:phenylalanine--tRNA ligase subunit beta [Deltaproteobacteria bacterium]
MKVPLNWLREFVPIDMDVEDLSHKLTMRGLEVESLEPIRTDFDGVVVGEILEMDKHPGADKLTVCRVDVGSDILPIVCGAANIHQGDKVPVALPGSRLPNGMAIEKRKVRGFESYGMLCSEQELAISDEHTGIFILPEDVKIGDPLEKALSLDDFVLDVNVPPNRGDCQSILGIAREVASLTGNMMVLPSFSIEEHEEFGSSLSLAIEDREACPRYVLRLIKNISIVPSPFWMRNKILKAGMRPINAIVDVTNFVMLELGQPLHAFDYHRIADRRIEVKVAKERSVFRTLDSLDRRLEPGDILICDGHGPVALAGIMGGENSEITAETKDVALESAFFHPLHIRRTARRLDLRSEASARFEKGIDIETVDFAAQRAISLMGQLAGGRVIKGSREIYERKEPRRISVRLKRISDLIGVQVKRETAVKSLNSLGIQVVKKEAERIECMVPSFRHDITEDIDIVEEIARTVGFENIPATMPVSMLLSVQKDPVDACLGLVRDYMVAAGFFEVINYGFFDEGDITKFGIGESDERAHMVRLLNPISKELGVMRTFLAAGILENLAYNLNRGIKNVRLFEVGKAFFRHDSTARESFRLAFAMAGKEREYFWREKPGESDFFDAKGVVEGFLERFGLQITVSPSQEPFLKAGNSCDLIVDKAKVGWIGQLDEEICKRFDIEDKVYAAEIDMDSLLTRGIPAPTYRPISRYPSVTRDFSFWIDEAIPVASLMEKIRAISSLIVSVGVFDMFKKEGRSVAFRAVFQSFEDTLKDEEVSAVQDRIISELTSIEGIRLR